MFSYRHGFHAGNHADVLKHAILLALLQHMTRKDKPFWYVDTHAGAGAYSLVEGFAAKREEFNNGIARLWDRHDLPPLLADYTAAVRAMNPDGRLQRYPGSPYLARGILRDTDRMRLFEWHRTESEVLTETFAGAGRQVQIMRADGFDALRSVMPPPPRRAVTLIDPSYEDKQDYARTLTAVADALRRFPTGTFAIWYPVVSRAEAQRFPAQLHALGCESWLHAALCISAPPADGIGLYGSGMFIVNPPYTLEAALSPVLPWLRDTLRLDDGGRFLLEAEIP